MTGVQTCALPIYLLYLLAQIAVVSEDAPVHAAVEATWALVRAQWAPIGAIFFVVLGIVAVGTLASILAMGALSLVGFVPLIGLAVLPLQVAAFAQQITVHADERAYAAFQASQGTAFPSRSFIPSGLISPSGEPVSPPESHALIAAHVIEAAPRQNSVSGEMYWWALVDTIGGTFDVVVDPGLLTGPLASGQIVSGWFWLSARVRREPPRQRGWFSRLVGR